MLFYLFFWSLFFSQVLSQNYIQPKEDLDHDYLDFVHQPKGNIFLNFIQYKLDIDEFKKQMEDIMRQRESERLAEQENKIYRKYLVSRVKGSSVLRDFHTMRY